MLKKLLIVTGVLLVLTVSILIAYILRPTPGASQPIEAMTFEIIDSNSTPAYDNSNPTSGSPVVFSIVSQGSEARFTLDELLRGEPTTVVGSTNQVAAEIAVDFENPEGVHVGTVLVNARTIMTDNSFRNRAISNEILDTGDFEFITFTPALITGIPESPQLGQEMVLRIIGDLTIRNITQEVSFDARITVDTHTQMRGYASTTINRQDYDLNIPNVASVAEVDEDVLLEIEFVATAK